MTDDEYWEQQNAIFRANVEWQERQRDLILKPNYYERYHAGAYEFISHGDPRAAGGVDTIASGKTIDEKIVQWPRKNGVLRADGYSAFALETMSCTVPGHERYGWMRTNVVNYLLYCFADIREETLDCYLIDFPGLQHWFYAQNHAQWPLWESDQANRTHCRIVPIAQVCQNVLTPMHKRFARPAHYDKDGHLIHYCYCGKDTGFGYGVNLRANKLGTWYCADHLPVPEPPKPVPERTPPPPPPPPAQGELF